MDGQDIAKTFHAKTQVVHDAIKGVAHDAACRTHTSKEHERLEAQLRKVSEEVTEMFRSLKSRE